MAKTDLNVFQTNALKGTTQTLFGGNFAATVTEANATSIDMTGWSGGSLDWTLVGNGTGNFAVALYGSEDGVAPFHPMYKEVDAGTFSSALSITTPTSASASYAIRDIRSNYIKFVPTLAGTVSGIFKFTPSK
jgi:hypothetical protein